VGVCVCVCVCVGVCVGVWVGVLSNLSSLSAFKLLHNTRIRTLQQCVFVTLSTGYLLNGSSITTENNTLCTGVLHLQLSFCTEHYHEVLTPHPTSRPWL